MMNVVQQNVVAGPRLEPSPKPEAKPEVKSVQILAQCVMSQSASEVTHLLEALMAEGQIEMDDLPVEDVPEAEAEDGDLLLSEVGWEDEDEVSPEPDRALPQTRYALRVSRAPDGTLRCTPPYWDWAGARGKTRFAQCVLRNVSQRLQCYRKLAEFLLQEHARELEKGPENLSLGLQQKIFMKEWLADLSIDAPSFSRFLGNCDLVWDEDLVPGAVSWPIKKLFVSRRQ